MRALPKRRLTELFADDPARLDKLSTRLELPGGGVLFDWTKTHLDDAHLAAFEAHMAGPPPDFSCGVRFLAVERMSNYVRSHPYEKYLRRLIRELAG